MAFWRKQLIALSLLLSGCHGYLTPTQAKRFSRNPKQRSTAHALVKADSATVRSVIQNETIGANKFMGMTQRQAVGDQTVSLLTCAVTLRNKAAIKALIKGGANPNFRTPHAGRLVGGG